jgi:FKBP-type peptidyl-prolyl cis-trans isomerase 2
VQDEGEVHVGQHFDAAGFGVDDMAVTVVAVPDGGVKVDAGHPLTGQDLYLKVMLVEV